MKWALNPVTGVLMRDAGTETGREGKGADTGDTATARESSQPPEVEEAGRTPEAWREHSLLGLLASRSLRA